MRKSLIIAFVLISHISFGQNTFDFLSPYVPITWLGIDFSKARFGGDYYKFRYLNYTAEFMESLNDLMVEEYDKYNIGKMLGGKNIVYQKTNVAKIHNRALDVSAILADSTRAHVSLSKNDIADIVSQYDFGDNKGTGLLFVVESFDKKVNEGLIWVTFVDMETKKIVLTEMVRGIPGGFNLRNYWAGSIHEIMGHVKKVEYKKWKTVYQPK